MSILLSSFLIFITVTLINSLNIEDFGAKANDISYETSIKNGKAFADAVLAANSGPDRTVLVEYGKLYNMLPYEPLNNITNVTIQIDGTLNAYITEFNQWPKDSSGRVLSFIEFSYCQNLLIKGNGSIDGFGYPWWWDVILNGHDNRPNLMNVYNSINTFIDGLTFYNAAQYHMALLNQLNLTVQNVRVFVNLTQDKMPIPTFPLNTDGIDVSGKDIYLRNLTIENYDDAVAVKPLQARPKNFVNCTENVLIEDCYVKYGVGMSIGSVPPNTDKNCVRNVTIRNIKFENPLKAIYIKPNPGNAGTGLISNILYENIEIREALWWAIFIGTQQQHQPHQDGTPCSFFYPLPGTECIANPLVTVENITLRNVSIYGGLLSPGILLCNQTNPCNNFVFDHVNVYNASQFPIEQGYLCENVNGYAIGSNLFPNCLKNITKLEDNFSSSPKKIQLFKKRNNIET